MSPSSLLIARRTSEEENAHRTFAEIEFAYRRRSLTGGTRERVRCLDGLRVRVRVRLRRSTDFLRR